MDLGLAGRVALVAGSTQGIGLAIARGFLAEGCRTVITGRDGDRLAATSSALAADFDASLLLAWRGDLTESDAIDRLLSQVRDRWGAIDCLVANIGSGRGSVGPVVEATEWDRLLEVNLASTYRLVSRVLPQMTGRRSGSIVAVASIAGLESLPAPLPYSAAKAALINYTKNLARQVGADGVRVNSVAPGNVLFPGGSWERHLEARREDVLAMIDVEVPLRRFGTPEEIADLVVFLSSDRASFITGACVVADGGQTRGS